MDEDFQALYQQLLDTFRNQNDSYAQSYKDLLNTSNTNNLEQLKAAQAGEMELMNNQYRNMAQLAREQSADWLSNNSKLMAESSVYRSKESDQQYRQDRQVQADRLENEKIMQGRQFQQDKDIIDKNEAVNMRRQNNERMSAIDAYRRF